MLLHRVLSGAYGHSSRWVNLDDAESERMSLRAVLILVCLASFACTERETELQVNESWPDALSLSSVHPALLLPSSALFALGTGLVPESVGTTRLRLIGVSTSLQGASESVDLRSLARFNHRRICCSNGCAGLQPALSVRSGAVLWRRSDRGRVDSFQSTLCIQPNDGRTRLP